MGRSEETTQGGREGEGGEDRSALERKRDKGGSGGYDAIDVVDGSGDGKWDILDDDLPPGFDVDLPTAAGRFAWAYVRGLGGLVMGVVDGLARGAPAGYRGYGGGWGERS